MILTKEEFEEYYAFNSQSAICRLIREKKIKTNKEGLIDTNDEFNISYCQKREEKIKRLQTKSKKKETNEPKQAKNQKSADQLALEIDILNARLEEKNQNVELKRLKIAKERKEVIETDVLNRCIQEIFGDMIKRLTEIPNIYAGDIIKTVQAEENPKELIVEFLTQKISQTLKLGLQSAKEAAKKYYEGENE